MFSRLERVNEIKLDSIQKLLFACVNSLPYSIRSTWVTSLISCEIYENNLHLARKCARIFVRGHYLFREANGFPRGASLGIVNEVAGRLEGLRSLVFNSDVRLGISRKANTAVCVQRIGNAHANTAIKRAFVSRYIVCERKGVMGGHIFHDLIKIKTFKAGQHGTLRLSS